MGVNRSVGRSDVIRVDLVATMVEHALLRPGWRTDFVVPLRSTRDRMHLSDPGRRYILGSGDEIDGVLIRLELGGDVRCNIWALALVELRLPRSRHLGDAESETAISCVEPFDSA